MQQRLPRATKLSFSIPGDHTPCCSGRGVSPHPPHGRRSAGYPRVTVHGDALGRFAASQRPGWLRVLRDLQQVFQPEGSAEGLAAQRLLAAGCPLWHQPLHRPCRPGFQGRWDCRLHTRPWQLRLKEPEKATDGENSSCCLWLATSTKIALFKLSFNL